MKLRVAGIVSEVVVAVDAARFALVGPVGRQSVNPSLEDTIIRLQAFERAGADVLFAPGLPDLNAVGAVCAALSKPVNFMVGIKGKSFSVAELAEAGVKRISLATSLYRAAMTGFLAAASEVKDS